jgi:MerR family transcriptional regulator, light-induced transcriptional regulator
MQQFAIRDIENLTGIKAHTLRIWEQRYGLITPKRKESLHRFYDNDDLKHILHIAFLYHKGWKISQIAAQTADERRRLVQEAVIGSSVHGAVLQLIEAAVDFDEAGFKKILQSLMESMDFEKLMLDICYPFLNRVGHLWSTNNVIPVQEHFSSYLIQNKVLVETEKLPASNAGEPEILLLAPRGEFHELPLLFMNYLLRKNGWRTFYIGVNINMDEVKTILQQHPVKTIYIHLLTNLTGFETDDYFEEVCRAFPDHQVVASGNGVQLAQRQFVNLRVLQSDEAIYSFIREKSTLEARSF